MSWQLQQAKARLSEVVARAQTDGPQDITVHGRRAVVVVSAAEYERLTRRKESFVEFMRSSPWVGVDLDMQRDPSPSRELDL